MAEETFKLPGASYDAISRIIQAYNHIGAKTNLDTVAPIAGMAPGEISRSTGFLVSVGLLEGGRDKGVTPVGQRLARALEFKEAADITSAWREALSGQTIIQRIIAAIRVRGGMDTSTLQTQIVYTAGADKNGKTLAGAGAIVEMMRQAGLIAERDGQVVALSGAEAQAPPHEERPESTEQVPVSVPVVQRVIEATSGSPSINLKLIVNLSVEPSQLPELGEQIRHMLENIGSEGDENEGRDGEEAR